MLYYNKMTEINDSKMKQKQTNKRYYSKKKKKANETVTFKFYVMYNELGKVAPLPFGFKDKVQLMESTMTKYQLIYFYFNFLADMALDKEDFADFEYTNMPPLEPADAEDDDDDDEDEDVDSLPKVMPYIETKKENI